MIAVTLNARNVPGLRMPNAQGNFCVGYPPATLWQTVTAAAHCGRLRGGAGRLLPAMRDSPKQSWPKRNWSKCTSQAQLGYGLS